MKEFDYYIFIDYSEEILGYMIVENIRIKELLPKISKFGHYRELRHKSSYIHSIKKRLERYKLREYLFKLKIKKIIDSPEIYADIAVFLKNHNNCIIFISIDNKQYSNFERLVQVINDKNIRVIKESQLKYGSKEYQMSLVLDTLLNIERLKRV